MSALYAFVAAGLFGCGLYMVLSRHLVRVLLGLSLLMFFAVGFGGVVFVRRGQRRTVGVPVEDDGP